MQYFSMDTKICNQCGQAKPFSEFHKKKGYKFGLHPTCKECRKRETAKYFSENKEAVTERNRIYREAHREELRHKERKKRQENPETIRARDRAYYAENKNLVLAVNNKWRKANQQHVNAWSRQWSAKNKELKATMGKKWREENPEIVKELAAAYRARPETKQSQRVHQAKRRADKSQQTPPWADLDEIKKLYDACPDGYHVDHIVPLRGEMVSGLHVPDNLQYLPAIENQIKGNRFKL